MSGMIDDAQLREIRERTNIVTIVSDYVSLKKAGKSYKGLCPFHNERSPSFNVHEDRQFFYCFGCQTGGDAIRFLQELNGYSFFEAVKALADRAGITLPEPTPRHAGQRGMPSEKKVSRSEKDACYAMSKSAQRFLADALHSTEGHTAAEYLRGRGINSDAVSRFGLGFAPDRWDGLESFFINQNENLELAVKLGLVSPRKTGKGHYDRFRNRVMFPIRNVAGEVVAFSGRDLSGEKEAAKYINSPETPVYIKGEHLFGLYEARQAIRKTGRAVLVEGNLDLVRLHQEGLEETVAPLGTALTETQARLIKRFVDVAVLMYDGDKAGRSATLKATAVCLSLGLQARVVVLPDGDDPDSYVGREGIESLRRLVDQSLPAWTHLVDTIVRDTDALADPAGPIRAIDELAPLLELLQDRRQRTLYERNIAERLGLELSEVQAFAGQKKRRTFREAPTTASEAPVPVIRRGDIPLRELNLMVLMLANPDSCALFSAHDVGSSLTDAPLRSALDRWVESWEAEEALEIAAFVTSIDDPHLRHALFSRLSERPGESDWKSAFEQLELGLKLEALGRDVRNQKRQLKAALVRGDDAEVDRLGTRAVAIDKEIEQLRATRGIRWQN